VTDDLLKSNLIEFIRITSFSPEEIECMQGLECDELRRIGGLLRETSLIFRNAVTLLAEKNK
jgi:hypothetical protein